MTAPDLERLIRIIVEEVAAAQATAAPVRCGCHAVLFECCPDRLRGVIEAGASRLGLHATGGEAGGVAAMIDHTLLKADATRAEIEALCREAAEYRFASVCVNPTWVATCARLLRMYADVPRGMQSFARSGANPFQPAEVAARLIALAAEERRS